MAKSYMEELAKMFNVEFGKPFVVSGGAFNPYKFTEKGLVDRDGDIQPSVLWYLLTGVYEIKKETLTPKEKAYLEAVVKPFIDRDVYIEKAEAGIHEYISVFVDNEDVPFPYFETGTLYKGMVSGKEYTLKELGLFE